MHAPHDSRRSRVRLPCHVRLQAAFYKAHLDGVPLRVMQHPLHYPQDTMFMAPGPIGQTAALPNDPELKRQMLQTARNHRTVFKRYNFDIKPKKGSFLWKAMHSWAKTEAEREAEEDFEDEMWGLTSRCAASLLDSLPCPWRLCHFHQCCLGYLTWRNVFRLQRSSATLLHYSP